MCKLKYFIFVFLFNFVSSQKACRTPNGLSGVCVPPLQCNHLFKISSSYGVPIPQHIRAYLVKFLCPDQKTFCCRTVPGEHPNIDILPLKNCGSTIQDNIARGNKTNINQFPWMAIMQYDSSAGTSQNCGGSLISNRYVLTAAHCIAPKGLRLKSVVLGEHNKVTVIDCNSNDSNQCAPETQTIEIESYLVHPEYKTKTKYNDIAIIRLKKDADTTKDNVKPVCITSNSEVPPVLIVTGWGSTETSRTSDELLQINMDVVDNNICQSKNKYNIAQSQFCAGNQPGVETCQGDSGSPAVFVDVLPNFGIPKYVQFGLVSVGKRGCGQNDSPNIFTKISYYYDWILDYMKP